MPLKI